MGTAGTTLEPSALTDSTEQMDAMDRMEDEGSPEPEEAQTVAAETVDGGLGAQADTSEPVVDDSSAAVSTATVPEPAQDAEDPLALRPLESLGVAPSQVEGRDPQDRPEGNRGTTSSGQAPSTSSGQAPSTSSGQAVPDPDAQ
jgi:hypothetical protein